MDRRRVLVSIKECDGYVTAKVYREDGDEVETVASAVCRPEHVEDLRRALSSTLPPEAPK